MNAEQQFRALKPKCTLLMRKRDVASIKELQITSQQLSEISSGLLSYTLLPLRVTLTEASRYSTVTCIVVQAESGLNIIVGDCLACV